MAITNVQKTKENLKVVALAGGVGGAKFAHGLAKILPESNLTVIVNTGDDFQHYGLHISPDLDTVMYTLAEVANSKTGWGLQNESWQMGDMMRAYGEDVWFNLGDRDLATHLLRTKMLQDGQTLTAVTMHLSAKLGIEHHIIPATNDPLATIVETKELGTLGFQQYFVQHRWQPTVEALKFQGQETAKTTSEVLAAIQAADVIFVCPSNPLLSIRPLLKPQGLELALREASAPIIAISPLINGKAVKGPTDKIMQELGLENNQVGIVDYYDDLLNALVIDISDSNEIETLTTTYPSLSVLVTPTLMKTIEDRAQLATRVINWISEVYT